MATEDAKTILFKVRRFSPERNEKTVSEFKVPVKKGTTLLDAFMFIKDNLDETFAFRHSCRMGVCGSCGVMVNGKPVLACYTQVLHLNASILDIAPLQGLPVIKDLIVDIEPFFEKYKRIENVLIKQEERLKKQEELSQTPTDLKKFWDLTMCIKCAICYSSCPAILDERFLGPSTLTTNYRFIADSRDQGSERRLQPMADNLWLCTSCNSCTLFCPKEVNCSESIVSERGLIVETGVIPRTAIEILSSTMKFHNPLGRNQVRRGDWAKELKIRSFPTTTQADVLYFVGCLASYDPRNQEISRALVSTFNRMNVDFFTLGAEEWCCGDHILRLGEKGLFEELAEHNLSVFKKADFKKIVTLSPHCFDAFKNSSPYLEAGIKAQHYTQVVAEALQKGRMKLTKPISKKTTYHDPCFLGKRNGIYDAPREILNSIPELELVEMERVRENSFCCGGGAGRVWTEDSAPEMRPSVSRVQEALEANAEIIATACPFCVSTLEDAVKVLDAENRIAVRDIAELLLEAM